LIEYEIETINFTKIFRSAKEREGRSYLGRIMRRDGDLEEKVAVDHINIKIRKAVRHLLKIREGPPTKGAKKAGIKGPPVTTYCLREISRSYATYIEPPSSPR